jgi:hypothetical protein
MESKKEQLEKELTQLAIDNGYDRISVSITMDENVTVEGVLLDVKSYLIARKTGKGIITLFTSK